MSDQRNLELDRMESEFQDVLLQTLGLPVIGSEVHAGIPVGSAATIELFISELNADYIGTDYLLSNQRSLLHFTSLRNLYSIINEGCVRLYNLNNSTDPNEYLHVANMLYPIFQFFDDKFNESTFADYLAKKKEDLFIMSCTETKEKQNPDFWKEFGDDFKGVAIEFKIINDPEIWSSFYFAKVKYGLDYSALTNFFCRWERLQSANLSNKYLIDLKQLIAFHKDNSYAKENEIRILAVPLRHNKHFDLYRYCTFTDVKRLSPDQTVQFFKMPLCDRNGNYLNNQWTEGTFHKDFIVHAPKLRISNVYFGPEFPNFPEAANKLKVYMFEKLKCRMPDFANNQIHL